MLEEWFKAAIADASGVSVWPLQASEKARPPFVVYQRTATERERYLDGPAIMPVVNFDLVIIAESFVESRELSNKIREGVPNFRDQHIKTTISDCWLEDESDDEPIEFSGDEAPWYVVKHTWNVRHEE